MPFFPDSTLSRNLESLTVLLPCLSGEDVTFTRSLNETALHYTSYTCTPILFPFHLRNRCFFTFHDSVLLPP